MKQAYFSKKSSLSEYQGGAQDEIIDSFYAERKNRSFSVKHHTLLRKNISYFQQVSQQEENSKQVDEKVQNKSIEYKVIREDVAMDREPLGEIRNMTETVNIKKYLSDYNSKPLQKGIINLQPKYQKVEDPVPESDPRTFFKMDSEFRVSKNLIKEQQKEEVEQINQLQREKKDNLTSKINIPKNDECGYTMRKRCLTENDKQIRERKYLKYQRSPTNNYNQISNEDQQRPKTVENHQMNNQQLIQQMRTPKLNIDMLQRQESERKLRKEVEQLRLEMQQIKNQRQKEEKLIQSIQKMRKTVKGVSQDCSLKELWRWIKQLPNKSL